MRLQFALIFYGENIIISTIYLLKQDTSRCIIANAVGNIWENMNCIVHIQLSDLE